MHNIQKHFLPHQRRIQGVSLKKIPGYVFLLDNAVIYTHSLFVTFTFIMYEAQSTYKAVHLKINVNSRFLKKIREIDKAILKLHMHMYTNN